MTVPLLFPVYTREIFIIVAREAQMQQSKYIVFATAAFVAIESVYQHGQSHIEISNSTNPIQQIGAIAISTSSSTR